MKSTTGSPPASARSDPPRRAARRTLAREERRSLNWLTLGAAAVVVWIVAPVALGIFLGMLVAFSFQPLYERWRPRLGPSLASLATVLVAMTGLLAAFGGLGWLLVARGSALAKSLIDSISPEGGASGLVGKLAELTSRFGLGRAELEDKLRAVAESAAARTAGIAETFLSTGATSLLAVFFAGLTMHLILRNWDRASLRAQEILPLRPDYTRALVEEFRKVGRTTLLGTIVTGVAQGLLATIGYFFTGVPEPVFFGAATAVASLIPAVGTLLVWVPIGVVLILTQHVTSGIIELVWGAAFIVGTSDYVIRPRLVGGEGELPSVVTFAALFGGVEVFGLKGLIVGPVLMSLGIAVLRIYGTEMRARRTRERAP